MKEKPNDPSMASVLDEIENGDIVDLPDIPEDFTDNIEGLMRALESSGFNAHATYIGTLHGFHLIYDGVMLSIAHPEIDENGMKAIQSRFLGVLYPSVDELYEGSLCEIRFREGGKVYKMWDLEIDFINWSEHFKNSPEAVLEALQFDSEQLRKYREEISGIRVKEAEPELPDEIIVSQSPQPIPEKPVIIKGSVGKFIDRLRGFRRPKTT